MSTKKFNILIAFFTFALFVAMSPVANASTKFADVPSNHEAFDEINYLQSLGIIQGYSEKGQQVFKLYNHVTRGQA
ncbi:MAG: S-layer homology domain-containing protein, partial [Lysinibacillus sp.]|nr:S-layer homology domain-containing protein [Lysinibacillus sp.]